MALDIRQATGRDGDALAALLLPVFRAGETYTVDPDISAEDAVSFWCAAGKTVFLAEDAGGPVGTYYIRANHGGGGDHVCNCGYVTAAGQEGRGVARAMLSHSVETARAMGFSAMQFNFVVETNARAVALWQRAGFEIVGRLPRAFRHPLQGAVDALVMMKDLRDGT